MIRIRSKQGSESTYPSVEEFTAAVRRGDVPDDAEIFHTRADRWLDIKTHPHYRLATGRTSGAEAVVADATDPPPPTVAALRLEPRSPVPTAIAGPPPQIIPPAQPGPVPPPMIRPGAAGAPPTPTQPPPRKSRELTFLDVGPPLAPPQRNGAAPTTKPVTPAAAKTTSPRADDKQFLVLNGGIESPVRTSAGHKTVSPDLERLIDTSLPGPSITAAPPLVPPTAPVASAAPVTPAVTKSGPAPPSPSTTPSRDSAPKVDFLPAEPAAADAPIVRPAAHVAPVDLTLPPPMTLHPAAAATLHADAESPGRSPVPLRRFAAPGAIVAAAAVMLVWQPWSSRTTEDPATTAASPAPLGSGLVPATTLTPAAAQAQRPGPATAPGAQAAGLSPNTAPADSIRATEQIVAAVRPSFRDQVDLNAAEVTIPAPGSTPTASVASARDLARGFRAAEEQALGELQGRLDGIGFRNLLAPGVIGNADGVTQTRAAWLSGAEAIRQYRGRIGQIERAYDDSVLASQRAQKWSGDEMRTWAARDNLSESGDAAQMTELMVRQVADGLQLLADQAGQYEIKDSGISFKDPAAAARYQAIRTWVDQRAQAWLATPESARPQSVNAVLRAMGNRLPPVRPQ